MELATSVKQFIEEHGLIQHGDCIVVGVSGGADSVCLLHLLVELKKTLALDIIVAHFNHGWRPDSDADHEFVRALAHSLKLECAHSRFDDPPVEPEIAYEGSQEAYARELRRAFFEHVAKIAQAKSVILGHTADDQEETFFIRMIRGASLEGLGAMKPKSALYVRPLLETRRRDIEVYLKERGIEFRQDSTNDSDDYLRNRIRKYVLPPLRDVDARFEKNFQSMLGHLSEANEFVQRLVDKCIRNMTVERDGIWWLNCDGLLAVDPYVRVPILLKLCILAKMEFVPSQGLFAEILRFITNKKSRKHLLGSSGELVKKTFSNSKGDKVRCLGFFPQKKSQQKGAWFPA